MAAATSAAIAAGAGILNTGAQMIMNKKNREFEAEQSQIQRDWNEKMFDAQNNWNYTMWQRQNEYNTPAAQVERMREAGLNPMFYGLDGTGNAGDLTAAQPLGYERASVNQLNPVSAGLDAALKIAQLQNVEADTSKKNSEKNQIDAKLPYEVEQLRSQIRQSNLNSDAQEIINKYLDAQQDAELRVKNSTVEVNNKAVEKAAAEIEKMDYEKTTMFIGWIETQEKILTLQKQRDLTDAQMEELASLIRKNDAEAKKIGLDVQNYDDITVIGTASQSFRLGPFSVSAGEPITLAMKKAAKAHQAELKAEQAEKSKDYEDNQNQAIRDMINEGQ